MKLVWCFVMSAQPYTPSPWKAEKEKMSEENTDAKGSNLVKQPDIKQKCRVRKGAELEIFATTTTTTKPKA